MKFKTSELQGDALDMAVMTAHGFKFQRGIPDGEYAVDERCHVGVWRQSPGGTWACMRCYDPDRPSRNWETGGPIIEREHLEFDFREDTQDYACFDGYRAATGPTHLIAAMRCYVASKLGEEIDIPEELLNGS